MTIQANTFARKRNQDSARLMFWHLPTRGVIRRETYDVPITVVGCSDKTRLIVTSADEKFRPDKQERIVIVTRWGPELQALVSFSEPMRNGRGFCELTAIFSRDRGILETFIEEVMRGRPEGAKFGARGAGWYLWMQPKATMTDTQKQEREEAAHGRRREPRVPVRVPVTCAIGGRPVKARAYNVSTNGLYVLVKLPKNKVPPKGTPIRVRYPVTVHIKPVELVLEGTICWVAEGTEKDQYGLGLSLSAFEDASDEQLWSRYVQNELDFRPNRVRVVTEKR